MPDRTRNADGSAEMAQRDLSEEGGATVEPQVGFRQSNSEICR
jgi:hypothetical protein